MGFTNSNPSPPTLVDSLRIMPPLLLLLLLTNNALAVMGSFVGITDADDDDGAGSSTRSVPSGDGSGYSDATCII